MKREMLYTRIVMVIIIVVAYLLVLIPRSS